MLRTSRTTGSMRDLAKASQIASEVSSSRVLPSFFRAKADPSSWLQVANDGMHPNFGLHHAAATGNVGLVKFALDNGQPHTSLLNGLLPLHAACSGGDEATVRLLLQYGANVNAARQKPDTKSIRSAETEGSTPLHFAAANGHIHVIRLLLERGASPAPRDRLGRSPEDIASRHGHLECASLIRVWVSTKGPTTSSSENHAPDAGFARSSADRTLKNQRSIDSFASAATSIKTSLRGRRRSQGRKDSSRQWSAGLSQAGVPAMPSRPSLEVQASHGSDRNSRSPSCPYLSQTIDTAYGQNRMPDFSRAAVQALPVFLADGQVSGKSLQQGEDGGMSLQQSKYNVSLASETMTYTPLGLRTGASMPAKLPSPSPSFLPSPESSRDSYFRCNKPEIAESAAEEDSQELLEASTDLCSPFHSRARTYSASSGNSRPMQPSQQQAASGRVSPPPSLVTSGNADCSRGFARTQHDKIVTDLQGAVLPTPASFNQDRTRAGFCSDDNDVVPTLQSSKTHTRGQIAHVRSGSGDSTSNKSDVSLASLGSLQGQGSRAVQANPLMRSIEEDIKALPRNASQASLRDVLAAYGDALHRQASSSTASIKPLRKTASSVSLQSTLFADLSFASRIPRRPFEHEIAPEMTSLGSTPSRASRLALIEDEPSCHSREGSSRGGHPAGDSSASLSSRSAIGFVPSSTRPAQSSLSSAHQEDLVSSGQTTRIESSPGAEAIPVGPSSESRKSSTTFHSDIPEEYPIRHSKLSIPSFSAHPPMPISATCPSRMRLRKKESAPSLSSVRLVSSFRLYLDSGETARHTHHNEDAIPFRKSAARGSHLREGSNEDTRSASERDRRRVYRKTLGKQSASPYDGQVVTSTLPQSGDTGSHLPLDAPPSPTFSSKSSRRARKKVRDVLTGLKNHIKR